MWYATFFVTRKQRYDRNSDNQKSARLKRSEFSTRENQRNYDAAKKLCLTVVRTLWESAAMRLAAVVVVVVSDAWSVVVCSTSPANTLLPVFGSMIARACFCLRCCCCWWRWSDDDDDEWCWGAVCCIGWTIIDGGPLLPPPPYPYTSVYTHSSSSSSSSSSNNSSSRTRCISRDGKDHYVLAFICIWVQPVWIGVLWSNHKQRSYKGSVHFSASEF